VGAMNLSEMQEALRWALDNRTNVTDTQLTRWLNWSYEHVGQPTMHRHQALQAESANTVTLVTDQVAYDIPNLAGFTFWGLYGIWYVDGTDASDRSLRRFRLKGSFDVRSTDEASQGTGRPTRYSVWGQTASTAAQGPIVNLDRRPTTGENGKVLLVRGYRSPIRLVDPTDITVLHPLWDEAIILGATWRGFRELSENARSEVAKANFATVVGMAQDASKLGAEDWGGAFEVDLQSYMPVS